PLRLIHSLINRFYPLLEVSYSLIKKAILSTKMLYRYYPLFYCSINYLLNVLLTASDWFQLPHPKFLLMLFCPFWYTVNENIKQQSHLRSEERRVGKESI